MPIHQRLAVAPGGSGALKGSIQIVYPLVEITRLEAAVDAAGVAGCLPRAAVDYEVLGALGDLGVQVVHEHAQGGFLVPAFAGDLRPPWSPDGRGLADVGHGLPPLSLEGVEVGLLPPSLQPAGA